jgi:hypothetical protein
MFRVYACSLFAVAGTWSTLAVEAALRLKLGADRRVNCSSVLREADGAGLVPRPRWDNGRRATGHELRNRSVDDTQQLWTAEMAETVLRSSHEAVAVLSRA